MAVEPSILCPSENEEIAYKYTRLHITPLNPTLLPSILPPVVLSAARNISYHSLQTFPEKEFGFVDLPSMEAQKIKKKLNGSILKGARVKIENARQSKQKPIDEETALPIAEVSAARDETTSKKRKRDTETLQGIELRDRKVKRGWTDPVAMKKLEKNLKGKKDVVKSKYTSSPELLFRTTLPPNKAVPMESSPVLKTERKKRKLAKEVVVHEFSKTTKHASFLRSSAVPSTAKGVAEYVEDKGWVDASGNIVEAPTTKSKKAAASRKVQVTPSSSESSASSEAEDGSDAEDSVQETEEEPKTATKQVLADISSTSSSGTSSDEDEEGKTDVSMLSDFESAGGDSSRAEEETNDTHPLPSPRTPVSLKLDIPRTESPIKPDSAHTVHPLEALFKRRRPNLEAPKIPEVVPPFSFFDAEGEDEEERDVVDSIPMTPYTKQDFALRGLRSAAPTPDTAFPGKSYNVWPTNNKFEEEGADIDVGATPIQKHETEDAYSQKDSTAAPISDFQKWFYEHRGENNRAWKRRRKVAAKEKRHRENKKRNERNA